ncbi:MAG TPA: ABC transporter permease [Gemmatimonadaceae bacterium]|nr:ABC transporter permease [Gemmatimonadaceae bacterium]
MDEPAWRRYLRLVRSDVNADVEDEVRFHLEMRARQLEADGLSPDDARRAALARFGDVEAVRTWLQTYDRQREQADRKRETLTMLLHHIRYAGRSLRKQPAFTTAAVLTLALGIGATTAIFGVVNGVLLRPLPFDHPERLVSMGHTTRLAAGVALPQSTGTYLTYRRLNRTMSDIGAYLEEAVNVTAGDMTTRIPAARVTASFFTVLRVPVLLGRVLTPDDELPGRAPVVVVGERFWRGDLGGASSVIGSMLRVDGIPHEIVGVVPEHVRLPSDDTRLWLPLWLDPATNNPFGFSYQALGRLREGVTREAAAADLQQALARMPDFFPAAAPGIPMQQVLAEAAPRVVLRPLRDQVVGDVGGVLWVIFGTICFVLVAACANIANLCLVRAEGRQTELAVRSALGAGRGELLTRFLAEGVILASAGAILGIGVAAGALRLLRGATTVPIPRLAEVRLDETVVLVSVVIAAMVALLTSALPILRVAGRDLTPHLRAGGRGTTRGAGRRTVQRGLVVVQVAMAFVLLAASTLMVRTFVSLRQVPLGFDAEHALTFKTALPVATYRGVMDVYRFYERLTAELEALPGVQSVGITGWLPLSAETVDLNTVWVEGREMPGQEIPPARPVVSASPSYFRSLGIPILSGRVFQGGEPGRVPPEVVVNATLARELWGPQGEREALGRRLRFLPEEHWLTVVGVAGSVRDAGLGSEPLPVIYMPLGVDAFAGMDSMAVITPRVGTVVVRTAGEPRSAVDAVRRVVRSLDPSLPVFELEPMDARVRRSMARTSFTALLLAIAAAVALGLGAIGLYGVVAYTVGVRRREIGLRIALGSPPTAVSRLLVRQGAVLAAIGAAVGLVTALGVTRVLRALLYGVSATDPLMLGGAVVLLLLVALAASWIPAWRASRVDPASVLSAD